MGNGKPEAAMRKIQRVCSRSLAENKESAQILSPGTQRNMAKLNSDSRLKAGRCSSIPTTAATAGEVAARATRACSGPACRGGGVPPK